MDGNTPHRISPILYVCEALAVVVTITFAVHDGFSQSAATIVAVAQMKIGGPPAGFNFARPGRGAPGQWTIVADQSADGSRVIEQSGTDRTDYRFPLAIYNAVVAKNIEVSVSVKPVARRVDRAGGIAVRVIDPDNYYVLRANALEDNVRFYRVVKGSRQQIGGVDIKITTDEWHSLGLKAEGDRFTIRLDGKTLFTVTDRTFADAGRIALWTKSDSVTRFSKIAIDVLPDQEKRP
jgi:hypothetical protein